MYGYNIQNVCVCVVINLGHKPSMTKIDGDNIIKFESPSLREKNDKKFNKSSWLLMNMYIQLCSNNEKL